MKKKFYYSFLLLAVIIVATMGILSPTHANPDTFGKTTKGANSTTYWNWNSKWGSRFKCPSDGIVTQISYYGRLVTGSKTVNFCVYSDNAGAPDKLLGYGSTTMSATAQWYTVTGLSVSVSANTYYWLAVSWGGFNIYYYYDAGATKQFIYQGDGADEPPPNNSFGSGTYLAREMSIYATFTPSGQDTKAPTYSNVGTNTTVAGNPCLFRAEWSDNVGLSGFIFGTNNTGTWQNTTWTDPWAGTPTSGWSDVSLTLNSAKGTRVEYRFWCNDTSNNWADTGTHYIITTHNAIRAVVIHSDYSYILPGEYINYDDAVVFGVLQGAGIPYDIKPANEMADVEKLKKYSLIVLPHFLAWRLPENLTEAVIAAVNDGVGVWTVGQGPGAENEAGQARDPMFISRLNNVYPTAWESMMPQLRVSSTYLIDGYYNPGDVVGVAQIGPQGLPRMGAFDPERPFYEVVSVFSGGSYKGGAFVASTLGKGRTVWSIGDPVIWQAHGILIRLVRWATKSPVFLELADSPSGMFLQIRIDGDALEGYDQAYKNFMWKIGNITDALVSLYFVTDVTTDEQYLMAKQYPKNEYGSHSKTHAWLVTLSPEALEQELNGSKSVIEAKLGWKITGFAYPFNGFNKTTTAGASAYDYVSIGYENNMSCVYPNSLYLQRPPNAQTTGLNTYSVMQSSLDDYNLFAVRRLAPPDVLQIWKNHYNLAAKQAEVSESIDIMGQLWHIKEMESYGITIYYDFLDWVVSKGGRFITAQQMVQGVKELEAVKMEYVKSGNVIKVTLDGSLSQGHSLRLFNSTDNIRSVTIDGQPWSNFRDKVVVLPSLGPGEHNIELRVGLVPTATIRGTVTDSGTGNPIAGANVTCDGTSTLTASDGTYSFNVILGSYTLTFTKLGYVTETRTQNCPVEGDYVVNVSMTRQTATIRGTVTDFETGSPIEGVNVTCVGPSTTILFQDGFESGDFSAWDPPEGSGTWSAEVVSDVKHHGDYSAKFHVEGLSWVHIHTIETRQPTVFTRIYGRSDSTPALWTEFTILQLIDTTYGGAQPAGVKWRNDASGLRWKLYVWDDALVEHTAYSSTPTINPLQWYCIEIKWFSGTGANGEVRLYVDGTEVCSITGLDLDAQQPNEWNDCHFGINTGSATFWYDCVVVADTYIGPEAPPPPPTLTASDGTYSFTVTTGSYTLTFSKAGYFNETRIQDCPIGGDYVVNVAMKRLTATIRGTVTDSITGNPIGGVNVTCDGASTLTASNGTYSFTVTLGSYTLTFKKLGYVSETRTQNCPTQGEYVVNVALNLITATITGTVTDNKTGVPLEAVRVTANGLETFTNSSGVYALVVRLGSYTLTFEKSGYYTNTTTVDCPTEGTYTVNISLTPLPPPPQPPVNYELVIEDMDGGNKLYAMHKFYHFTAKAYDNDGDISMIRIAFTDGVTWANFSFTVSDRTFSRLSGYLIAELNVSDCSYEIGGGWVNATFSIRIKYGVDDAPNIELYQLSEDTLGNTTGWQTMQTDYADIVQPSVSVPGPLGTSLAMVGSLAGAVALWILWRKREEKEQIQDGTLPPSTGVRDEVSR